MAANFANQIFKIKIPPTFANNELFLSLSKAQSINEIKTWWKSSCSCTRKNFSTVFHTTDCNTGIEQSVILAKTKPRSRLQLLKAIITEGLMHFVLFAYI